MRLNVENEKLKERIGFGTGPSPADLARRLEELEAMLRRQLILVRKILTNRWKIEANQLIIYDDDGATPLIRFDLYDKEGLPTEVNVYERVPK